MTAITERWIFGFSAATEYKTIGFPDKIATCIKDLVGTFDQQRAIPDHSNPASGGGVNLVIPGTWPFGQIGIYRGTLRQTVLQSTTGTLVNGTNNRFGIAAG
jgi:hypothetical protein